jgi:hypothetical protein
LKSHLNLRQNPPAKLTGHGTRQLLPLKNLTNANLATIENEAHEEDECTYLALSALPPKADMCGAIRNVRFGPKADIPRCERDAVIRTPRRR